MSTVTLSAVYIIDYACYVYVHIRNAREAGALCICDEVQVGFGRVGTHMWAFEHQGKHMSTCSE